MPCPSPRVRARLQVEELESRLTPSGLQPSPLEQEFLERLNDARANPAAPCHLPRELIQDIRRLPGTFTGFAAA